jgi:hydrogenase maturation protein HypF
VKGLGGFQLACRADSDAAVTRLRERKRRPTKPFAVMARDLSAARRLVRLDDGEVAMLLSPRSPVLLAPRREKAPVADGVAPGLDDVGIMLPTTPLHVELFRGAAFEALVMTSGNVSEEPICRTNLEALERLAGIADLFLLHDREVVRRVDDSVMRTTPRGPIVVRRARGFVPEPLPLPEPSERATLAMGGHLQVTACLAAGTEAFCSQHVGDLDGEPARAFLSEVALGLEEFLEAQAEVIAVDLHPDYASVWLGKALADERGACLVAVQHHLAHAAATLAEHGAFPAAGEVAAALVLDGTGWGEDGVAWGGELLLVHGDLRWRRLAHFTPIPLVGGERAVREPWRVLAAALAREGCAELLPRLPLAALVSRDSLATAARLAASPHWPLATGAGRVFEAAGALLGLTATNRWEGEAAALVESLASLAAPAEPWPEVSLDVSGAAPLVPGPALLAAAAQRLLAGTERATVAAGFHATLARLAVAAVKAGIPEGVRTVALGGGCLVNRLLIDELVAGLEAAGFEPLLPRSVPPGDGGLSYGQAVIAALSLARASEPHLEGES